MSTPPSNIVDDFLQFEAVLSLDQARREKIFECVRDLEKVVQKVLTTLQGIHMDTGRTEIPNICVNANKFMDQIKGGYSELAKRVPSQEYYKYHDIWKFVTQRLTFAISLIKFLKTGQLASREFVAYQLGLQVQQSAGFHLDLEDYLHGLLTLSSELARFAVNSATSGDYNRPLQISNFVNEINAGFRLLNFKNDSLRKRFDGLKYDLKKIEEVVYDLSIRGLRPPPESKATPEAKPVSPTPQESTSAPEKQPRKQSSPVKQMSSEKKSSIVDESNPLEATDD